ncbi:MAG: sugar phosphate isomerase/epimerase [Verrucomicrobia subdivision 3 bacterium]|nr:sugar phosphate isomerase/epimerase [Limisphaerales bacterium]
MISRNLIEPNINRRTFLQTTTAAILGATVAVAADSPPPRRRIKLGLDNFSVRAMGWKAPALIDYAASLQTDSLFISDLNAFDSFDDKHLAEVKSRAADKGLQIHLGTWSVCPSSKTFNPKWGTAEEHLALGIRVAKALGSPVLRVILGNGEDRKSPGGIEARIADTVKVLKTARSKALDAGVKIAMENHAGDMQATEVAQLIEAAGKDYVGANMDSGNAVWTMEDPLASLEVLGPYVVTTSLRDSAIWESANGATVQWTAMGDGIIDLKRYFDRFAELCPGVPVHIETISGFNREIPYLNPDFWKAWPNVKAQDFARFVALARKGKPRGPFKAPEGKDRKLAEQEYQKAEIDKSIRFCKETLGLGE